MEDVPAANFSASGASPVVGDGESATADRADLVDLQRRFERFLLEGPTYLTRQQVAARVGVSVDEASRLWRALGFADTDDDVPAFADIDVEVLGLAITLERRGVLDGVSQSAVTRTVGQAMSRLAEWQVGFLVGLLTDETRTGVIGSDRTVGDFVEEMIPTLERFHDYAWRRHLAAYTSRALNGIGGERTADSAVGFVDISGYTSLSRKIDSEALGGLLERFEALCADQVANHHGRIVKSLGDEVMFVVDDPAAAGDLALTIVAQCHEDADLPDVRAGLAYGTMMSRYGDLFGSTVNLASRLTSIARPSSVLVDRGFADVLRERGLPERISLRPLSRVSVRGFAHLQPWLLRRTG